LKITTQGTMPKIKVIAQQYFTHDDADLVSARRFQSEVRCNEFRLCPEWVPRRHFGAQLWRNICSVLRSRTQLERIPRDF